jgi:hypothetical protein
VSDRFIHNTPWQTAETVAYRDLVTLKHECAWFADDPHLRLVLERSFCFGAWAYRFTVIGPEHK